MWIGERWRADRPTVRPTDRPTDRPLPSPLSPRPCQSRTWNPFRLSPGLAAIGRQTAGRRSRTTGCTTSAAERADPRHKEAQKKHAARGGGRPHPLAPMPPVRARNRRPPSWGAGTARALHLSPHLLRGVTSPARAAPAEPTSDDRRWRLPVLGHVGHCWGTKATRGPPGRRAARGRCSTPRAPLTSRGLRARARAREAGSTTHHTQHTRCMEHGAETHCDGTHAPHCSISIPK